MSAADESHGATRYDRTRSGDFTQEQLDRIFRQVMSTEEAMAVCDGIRALLARDLDRYEEERSRV